MITFERHSVSRVIVLEDDGELRSVMGLINYDKKEGYWIFQICEGGETFTSCALSILSNYLDYLND